MEYNVYIPINEFEIKEGTYYINDIVTLLRENCERPQVIAFIADMMEI